MKARTFKFRGSNTLGILEYLHDTYKNDYSNYVFADGSSSYSKSNDFMHAIDFNTGTYWICKKNSELGQYISIHFPKNMIEIKGYFIQTSYYAAGACHPKQWTFDASNDNISWVHSKETIDENSKMNGNYNWMYVPYNKGIFQHFRITVTGKSYCSGDFENGMDVNQIELFGTLYPLNYVKPKQISCRTNINHFKVGIWITSFIIS